MDIFKISLTDEGALRVEAAAATEISFEVNRLEKLDQQQLLADILRLAIPMMAADVALTELGDGNTGPISQATLNLWRIKAFGQKYAKHLVNVETDLFEEVLNGRRK